MSWTFIRGNGGRFENAKKENLGRMPSLSKGRKVSDKSILFVGVQACAQVQQGPRPKR